MTEKRGVLVRLSRGENGLLRVVLNDAVSEGDELIWRKDVLYTFKDYSKEEFSELHFDEKEVADFGYSILARLYAFCEEEQP